MAPSMTEERWAEALRRMAVLRFGEERAKQLEPAIRDMARSLFLIGKQELILEAEPAFLS